MQIDPTQEICLQCKKQMIRLPPGNMMSYSSSAATKRWAQRRVGSSFSEAATVVGHLP